MASKSQVKNKVMDVCMQYENTTPNGFWDIVRKKKHGRIAKQGDDNIHVSIRGRGIKRRYSWWQNN